MVRRGQVTPEAAGMLESQGINVPGNGNGNGHKGFNEETAGLWGNNDEFSKIMKQMDQPSIGRELVHPGKDALDISMRTVLENRDESKVIMQLISWCREFDFEEGLEDIKTQLALYNSVGGYSRDQFIQAITQQYKGTDYPGIKKTKQPQRKEEKAEKDSFE